jgi:hypothetical protein
MLPPLLESPDTIAERFFASLRFEQRGKQNQLGIQLEQFCLGKIEPEKNVKRQSFILMFQNHLKPHLTFRKLLL